MICPTCHTDHADRHAANLIDGSCPESAYARAISDSQHQRLAAPIATRPAEARP